MTRTIRPAAVETEVLTGSPVDAEIAASASSQKEQPAILRDVLVRTAAFVVLASASTALLALPYLASGGDGAEDQAAYSARLERALQVADGMAVRDGLMETVSAAAKKADRLTTGSACGAQSRPNIEARCRAEADDSGPASPIGTVTVEYRLGESSSALLRLPVQQIASQQ